MGFVYIVLIILFFVVTCYGWELRKELKKKDYWKSLPKGTVVYGYCLPILLWIILSSEHIGFIRITVSILLVIVFIVCVAGVSNNLKEKPLEGCANLLPEEERKKVVTFYALTPLLTILVIFFVGIILDSFFKLCDYMKRQGKNGR